MVIAKKAKPAAKKAKPAAKKATGTPRERRVAAQFRRLKRLLDPAATQRALQREIGAQKAISHAELMPAFDAFLKREAVRKSSLSPARCLGLLVQFYREVSFTGRSKEKGGDMLLYEQLTSKVTGASTLHFVRQLYSRGRGHQLCIDFEYPAKTVDFTENSASMWNKNLKATEAWERSVKERLADISASADRSRPSVAVSLAEF